ncbi:hypothetical protein SDC9_86726 [bioreactor metagenome]|uniref:Uncharacterized protein n=1 Tax=bioreactor metagenome TaxID=1076179 RepID=A0A644ZID0_9ZZZZ
MEGTLFKVFFTGTGKVFENVVKHRIEHLRIFTVDPVKQGVECLTVLGCVGEVKKGEILGDETFGN